MGYHRRITKNDIAVHKFILGYKALHTGGTPTYREIVSGTPYKSISTIASSLEKLEDAGYLHMNGTHIILNGEGWVPPIKRFPEEGEIVYSKYEVLNNMITGMHEVIDYMSNMRDMAFGENTLEDKLLSTLFEVNEYFYEETDKIARGSQFHK